MNENDIEKLKAIDNIQINENDIEKLKAIDDNIQISEAEVAEVKELILKGNICITICEWIIKKAVGTGSCVAGEAALGGIFTLAEIVFFPEGEEILVPLEEIVMEAWGVTCAEIGVKALGDDAHKYAKEWCSKI